MSERIYKFLFVALFIINACLYVFRFGNQPLGGDEAAAYISILPFFHSLFSGQFIPSFLVFFHEPMFLVIQSFMLIFGASSIFVRLPNILAGIALFLVLIKIGRLLFGKYSFYTLLLLLLYTFGGHTIFLRIGIHIGIFNLLLATSLYFALKYAANKHLPDFYHSFLFLLINFFVYIDAIFCLPGLIYAFFKTKTPLKTIFTRNLLIPGIIGVTVFLIWALGVFLGSYISGAYNWQIQAPFRLLLRGGSYSLVSIFQNFELFTGSNSLEYFLLILVFSAISILDKRAKIVWGYLVFPLVFFNIVNNPTVHPLFFIVLLLITTVLGFRFVIEKIDVSKYIIAALLIFGITKNIALISLSNPFTADNDYKKAATIVNRITLKCEPIYINSSLDGSAIRFYFNRGYVTDLNSDIKTAFVDGENAFLETNGFVRSAQVIRFGKQNLSIYQRSYVGDVINLENIDNNLFKFSSFLTYISECYFSK